MLHFLGHLRKTLCWARASEFFSRLVSIFNSIFHSSPRKSTFWFQINFSNYSSCTDAYVYVDATILLKTWKKKTGIIFQEKLHATILLARDHDYRKANIAIHTPHHYTVLQLVLCLSEEGTVRSSLFLISFLDVMKLKAGIKTATNSRCIYWEQLDQIDART